MKACRGCGQVKSLDQFVRDSRLSTGRGSRCVTCARDAVRSWERRHRDKRAEYHRRDRAKHPEAAREQNRRRRALLVGAAGQLSAADWKRTLNRFGGLCAYCGAVATSQDHVLPLSRGGSHTVGNVVPACASCNSSKKDRLLVEWRQNELSSQRR